jgi:hypothetical protein
VQTLFQPEAAREIVERIDRLSPALPPVWGKMDIAQMLAHCSAVLDVASGKVNPPRIFIGRIVGPLLRSKFSSDKPFPQGAPTDKSMLITGSREFKLEREQLKERIRQFQSGGEARCTSHPHPFFGAITPREWGIGMYKHLDHHLRQFAG